MLPVAHEMGANSYQTGMNGEISRGETCCDMVSSSRGSSPWNFYEGYSGYRKMNSGWAFHGEYCLQEIHGHLTCNIFSIALLCY